MTDSAVTVAICDAGPLIHLDELGCLELLTDFDRVLVPPTVWDEAAKHRPDFWRGKAVVFQQTRPPGRISPELEALAQLLALHAGEAEALQLAQATHGALLLSDDSAAHVDDHARASMRSAGSSPRLHAWPNVSPAADASARPLISPMRRTAASVTSDLEPATAGPNSDRPLQRMPRPSLPQVPPQAWLECLEQLSAFQAAAPWRWMADADASVHTDPAGVPWFACTLGAAREVYGLCLYRGAAGLATFRAFVRSDGEIDFEYWSRRQDALTIWFGPKSELDLDTREIYRRVGFSPPKGSRHAYPLVRSHRPGYFPWHPETSELSWLTAAIPRVLAFAELFHAHPDLYSGRGPDDLPSVPPSGPLTAGPLEWRTWLPPSVERPAAAPISFDPADFAAARAQTLPQDPAWTFECDVRLMPEPVTGGGRPYYPQGVMVVRGEDAYCCGVEMIAQDEDPAVGAVRVLIAAMMRIGCRPARLAVTDGDLADRLQSWAKALHIELLLVEVLPALDHFWASFQAHSSKLRHGR